MNRTNFVERQAVCAGFKRIANTSDVVAVGEEDPPINGVRAGLRFTRHEQRVIALQEQSQGSSESGANWIADLRRNYQLRATIVTYSTRKERDHERLLMAARRAVPMHRPASKSYHQLGQQRPIHWTRMPFQIVDCNTSCRSAYEVSCRARA